MDSYEKETIRAKIRYLKEINIKVEKEILLKQEIFEKLDDGLVEQTNFDELLMKEIEDLIYLYINNAHEISKYENILIENGDTNEYCRGYIVNYL